MALWNVFGQVVDDSQEGVHIPANAVRLPEYRLDYQFGGPVQWEGWQGGDTPAGVQQTAPGYISQLLQWADRAEQGQLKPYEQDQWETMRQQALAVPTRNVQDLQFSWGPQGDQGWGNVLGVSSPDLGAQLLGIRERMQQGKATPHERALFGELRNVGADWDYRATVPQASDANPFGLGDNLIGALMTLGLGATGGLAAAPLAAGGAGLATTLGSLGTLSGIAGTGAGVLGQALDQPWLSRAGTVLGALGGIAGGAGGLANLWSTGVHSLGDAARLASSAGRVVGGVGSASGVPGLQQAGRYLGLAGNVGRVGSGVEGLLGAAQAGQPMGPPAQGLVSTLGSLGGGVRGLLGAAQGAQRRTSPPPRQGTPFANVDWLRR